MLRRTIVGILIAVFLLVCLYFGDLLFIAAFSVIFVMAVHDLRHVLETDGKKVFLVPVYVFAALFGFVFYITGGSIKNVAAFALLCLATSIVGQVIISPDNFAAAPFSLLPYAYPLLSAVCLIALRCGFESGFSTTVASLAILAPLGGDSLAYFCGFLLGKHSFFPHISPKKTVEGAVGALIGGTLVGLVLFYLQALWGGAVALWVLMLLGLACGILGQFGDLFASVLKRSAGLKDFSGYIPGHGGTLDRIDSVLLCAPVILAYALLVR